MVSMKIYRLVSSFEEIELVGGTYLLQNGAQQNEPNLEFKACYRCCDVSSSSFCVGKLWKQQLVEL